MKATLLEHMGGDLTVVNAARVSFANKSDWEEVPDVLLSGKCLSERDAKLVHYLAKHGHFTPFTHPQASFHIEAPIFVARQLAKHQVGLAWNEVSRRYVDTGVRFHIPDTLRERAENKKQGSGDKHPLSALFTPAMNSLFGQCANLYTEMIEKGICPEQARAVLPLATYTQWIWTGSLAAFARVCKLRLSDDAQAETREIAAQIAAQMEPLFPVSWPALMEN